MCRVNVKHYFLMNIVMLLVKSFKSYVIIIPKFNQYDLSFYVTFFRIDWLYTADTIREFPITFPKQH